MKGIMSLLLLSLLSCGTLGYHLGAGHSSGLQGASPLASVAHMAASSPLASLANMAPLSPLANVAHMAPLSPLMSVSNMAPLSALAGYSPYARADPLTSALWASQRAYPFSAYGFV